MTRSDLRAVYTRTLPDWFRRPIRNVRNACWNVVANVFDGPTRKRHLMKARLALGQYATCVDCHGMRLHVDIRDQQGVGGQLYIKRDFEPEETEFLLSALKPGMVVVDIGANLGYYTVLAAKAVGPTGMVVAFEPDQTNYQMLLNNIQENNLGNIKTLNVALGSSPGTANLFRNDLNYGDHRLWDNSRDGAGRESVTVQVEPLDKALKDCNINKVDFIKIDVQGYECQVASGMKGLLASSNSLTVLSEFWPYGLRKSGGSDRDYIRMFEDNQFDVFALNRENGHALIRSNYDDLLKQLPRFVEAEPDGCYLNVVFKKKESA
jgi:FkbM family methyltransferase